MVTEEEEARALEEDKLVVDDEEDELGLAMLVTTRWHVIVVGCVAIWPATIPKMRRHREVAFLALSVGNLLNPAKKGQEIVDEVGKLGLVRWGSYMMKRDMSIPSTTKVNYTYPTIPRKLLPLERLRRKKIKLQKTEKDIC